MSSENAPNLTKDLFLEEYTPEFVNRWDELINWRGRWKAEGGFFQRLLQEYGAKKVLDIACGTGFHTVALALDGFNVTGADGAATMVAKAKENTGRFGLNVPVVEAEWTSLTRAFPNEKFDAVICLGNAFTHLFDEPDRKKALSEIYQVLKDGGLAIIDHRNYDKILDKGYDSKHMYYYVGDNVHVYPEEANDQFVRFRYQYEDGSSYHLTLCPIRQSYVSGLLREAGFADVWRYGDFLDEYEHYDPDFIVQVARR